MTMKSCNLVVISSAGFIPIADSGLCGILFQAHLFISSLPPQVTDTHKHPITKRKIGFYFLCHDPQTYT